jgi:uncharacterized cupredoxin-like copper-binding protein
MDTSDSRCTSAWALYGLTRISTRLSLCSPRSAPDRKLARHPCARLVLQLGVAVGMAAPMTAAAVDWAKARQVSVVTIEYRFEPNHLVFQRGVAYRLAVINKGHELHELTAPDFFKVIKMRNVNALNSEQTEIVVQPGEQKELYFIASRSGHFAMWCADHDWAGMTGDITIE